MVSGKHVEVLVYSTLPREDELAEFQQLNLARGNYAMGTSKNFQKQDRKNALCPTMGPWSLPAELVVPSIIRAKQHQLTQ